MVSLVCILQAQHTGASLLGELTGRWRLREELEAVRNLYLGGAPLLEGFMHDLIDRLVEGESLHDIPDVELQVDRIPPNRYFFFAGFMYH